MEQHGEKQDFESVHGARGGNYFSTAALEEGGRSGNKREIETETNFLLHQTDYKEIQERLLNVRNKINIPVNNKEEKKCYFTSEKGKGLAKQQTNKTSYKRSRTQA